MERYLTIQNHPNYEVSNFGNVRNKKTGTIRKLTERNGYKKIRLDNKDESVHRLVADTFYDGEHDNLHVNHIDGNKSNNSISNLEWVTPSENVKHAYRTGLKHHSGGTKPIPVVDETTNKTYDSLVNLVSDIGGTRQGAKYALDHNNMYRNHRIKLLKEV